MRNSTGFTFIELMIVITIIGVLAAIAIPNYTVYRNRARYTEVMTLVEPVKKTVGEYYDRWGEFPKDNTSAGLPSRSLCRPLCERYQCGGGRHLR